MDQQKPHAISFSITNTLLTQKSRLYIFFVFALLISVCSKTYAMQEASCDELCQRENNIRNSAQGLAEAINNRDNQAVQKFIDFDAIADVASAKVGGSTRQQRELKSGFMMAGPEALADAILTNLIGTSSPTWFLRLITEDEETRPVLRIDFENGGHEYMVLSMNEQGTQLIDIIFATSGAKYTEQLADAARLMIKPSKSMLKSLFGGTEVDEGLVDIFQKIGVLRQEQKFAQAYDLLKTASTSAQTSKTGALLGVMLSQHVSDKAYDTELRLLAKHHGNDPDLQFMLVDYYTITEQYNRAVNALNVVEKRLGQDGALFNLKASLRLAQQNYDESLELIKQAIDIENDFEDSYWTLVTIYIEQQNYSAVSASLNLIVDTFDYSFERANFESIDFYADFVKSNEFDTWISEHIASQ